MLLLRIELNLLKKHSFSECVRIITPEQGDVEAGDPGAPYLSKILPFSVL